MKITMIWVLVFVSVVNGSMLQRIRMELAFRINNIRNFDLEDCRLQQQCTSDFRRAVRIYNILWEFIKSNDAQRAKTKLKVFKIEGADSLLDDDDANETERGRMATSRKIKRKHAEKLRIMSMFIEVFIDHVNLHMRESKNENPDASYLSLLKRGAIGYCAVKEDNK